MVKAAPGRRVYIFPHTFILLQRIFARYELFCAPLRNRCMSYVWPPKSTPTMFGAGEPCELVPPGLGILCIHLSCTVLGAERLGARR